MTADTPEAAAAHLFATRTEADAYCHREMCLWMAHARACTAGLRVIFDAQEKGYGLDPCTTEALAAFRQRIDFCRNHVVIFSVRRAVLSGRWPEVDEGEAWARCATDDGLMAFLDEIARIPIGFVDPPVVPQVRN